MKKTIISIFIFSLFLLLAYFSYYELKNKVGVPNQLGEVMTTATTTINSDNKNIDESDDENIDDRTKVIDFTVIDNDGNDVKLSDMTGKPIVLNFWASWCSPCKQEMPEFNEVYNDMKDEIIFMMIDLVDGQRETEQKGKKYIEEMGFSFPVYFDTTQEAAILYGITYIPTTLFIDKDGYIVTGARGGINKELLLKGIDFIRDDNGEKPDED